MDDLVDLGLGTDVDAACGFVEQQHFHRHRQPATENGLLLIATGQVHDFLRRVGRLHFQRLDLLLGVVLLPQATQQATEGGVGASGADVDVLGDAGQRQDAFLLAVLGAQQDPGGNRVPG
ncbi:hypothetical protein D3C75_423340 [compost metagenome]